MRTTAVKIATSSAVPPTPNRRGMTTLPLQMHGRSTRKTLEGWQTWVRLFGRNSIYIMHHRFWVNLLVK